MMNKETKGKAGWGQIQIGTSSLVLIFTVLCLVIFSTLSLASAKVDENLAEKNQQHIMDYYVGDGKAEEELKKIDGTLSDFQKIARGESDYQSLIEEGLGTVYPIEDNRLTYRTDINQEQFLLVELELFTLDKKRVSGKNYGIRAWTVKNKVDYEIDDDMPVWDGNRVE